MDALRDVIVHVVVVAPAVVEVAAGGRLVVERRFGAVLGDGAGSLGGGALAGVGGIRGVVPAHGV